MQGKENKRIITSRLIKGYKFDKFIFRTLILLVFFLTFLIIMKYGIQDKLYVSCPKDAYNYCINPYYEMCGVDVCDNFIRSCVVPESICTRELILPGEYIGEKQAKIFDYFGTIVLILSAIALLINHYVHNRGRKIIIDYENKL